MKRLAMRAVVGLSLVASFAALSRASEGPSDRSSAKQPSAAAQKDRNGPARAPGGWGYHPWHDQWHRGYWPDAGSGSGSPARWGWNGPWAWKFVAGGPGAAAYYNPFCGQCQPIVLRETYRRPRSRAFTFGGGLQSPNEDRGDTYQEYRVTIDYSRPLDASAHFDPNLGNYPAHAPVVSSAARANLDSARGAFYRADYNLALQYVNSALFRMPRDSAIHEFRALVLFALGRYSEAATALNAVLAIGPGWNWTTMSGLYRNVDTYTTQLRALEAYSKKNANAADGHFLLAYHYLTDGYPEAAVKQLQQVLDLEPRANVAARLLQELSAPTETEGAAPESAAPPAGKSPAGALDVSRLAGTWKGALPDRTPVTMTLETNLDYTWTFIRQGKTTTLSGAYLLGGNTLLLQDDTAGVMSGQVSLADGTLKFKPTGAPAGQGEIVFRR